MLRDMYERNIEVFKDTRAKSVSKYFNETARMISRTDILGEAFVPFEGEEKNFFSDKNMLIRFVNGGTVNTAYDLKNDKNYVAMLNFADAKKPGGWVELGAPTQEECICRCTNLYEGLITPKCHNGYYAINNPFNTDEHLTEAYTDTIIYMEDVLIFKDDVTYEDVPVKKVDVITCPAPCGYFKNAREIITQRAKAVIGSAYLHGVTDIVLGAWGCGAFGQDAEIVARSFADVLEEYPVFNSVVFAIRETLETGADNSRSTFSIFSDAFADEYVIRGGSID